MHLLPLLPSAILSGVLLAICNLPGPQGLLAFVALLPLLAHLAAAPALRRAALAGLMTGVIGFGGGYFWLATSDIGGGPALPIAWGVLLLPLAAGTAGFAVFLAWVARTSPRWALAAAPAAWIAFELARIQEWLVSLPASNLAYALGDHPFLIQSAGVVGLYGLSFWVVAVNAAPLLLPRLPRLAAAALGVALALPLVPALGLYTDSVNEAGVGAVTAARADTPAGSSLGSYTDAHAGAGDIERIARDTLVVAAVQPAVPSSLRHKVDRFHPNLRLLLELSNGVLADAPDILVWPESAYERVLDPAGDSFLETVAHHLGVPLVTGAWRGPSPASPTWHNSAVLVATDASPVTIADKVHPVPVYERVPDGFVGRVLARRGLARGRFTRGEPARPVSITSSAGATVPFGVLVCIDIAYPELARGLRAQGARLLLAITNEAGIGILGARHHTRIARLRAVENRMPLVRVANTGPTVWIDERGRSSAVLPAGAAAGSHAVALAGPPPPAVALGSRPAQSLAALLILAAALARVRDLFSTASLAVPHAPSPSRRKALALLLAGITAR